MSRIMRANGTIRRARFCKIDASDNNSVLEADANERTIGISQIGGRETPLPSVNADPAEAANSGDNVMVHGINSGRQDISLEIGSGGCTAGDLLKSDADGKGIKSATTGTTVQWIGAIALETASDGELAKVEPVMFAFRPALT